jgi:tRNA splicing ligase
MWPVSIIQFGEEQMAGLEYFQLGHDAGIADRNCHLLKMRRRVHEDLVAHVHAAHVEATDFRSELDHMTGNPIKRYEMRQRRKSPDD